MKALVIVDMCKGFVNFETGDGECALHLPGADGLIPEINSLMTRMSGENWVVIHVNDGHDEDDPEFNKFPPHCIYNTEESETADGFKYGGLGVYTVHKTSFSGYLDISDVLDMWEITGAVVCGVATDYCVFATAADLASAGFDVTVLRSCVMPIDDNLGKAALELLHNIYGVLIL